MEQEKSEWGIKAYKQIVKLMISMKKPVHETIEALSELLKYVEEKSVTKNKAEKFAKSLNTIQRAFIELQEDDAKKKKKAKAGAGGKKQKA